MYILYIVYFNNVYNKYIIMWINVVYSNIYRIQQY